MKALFLLPSVLAMQVTEDHGATMNLKGDIEGMKELFLSVSKSTIDETTRRAVATMMEQITNEVGRAVDEEMLSHNNTLDCKYDKILACSSDRSKFYSTRDVDGLKNASNTAKQDHRNCRADEQTQCNTRNGLNAQCDTEVEALSKCARHREHWERNSATVKKWIECLHKQVGDVEKLISTHEEYEKECKRQCATRETCNGEQTEFEVKMCGWMTAVDEMCYEYDGCYADEVERYKEKIQHAKDAHVIATTQMKALTTLKCYGQSILDNRTSLEHCDGIPCENCPVDPCEAHCPEEPSPVPCSERVRSGGKLMPRPCEGNFLDEEYNNMGMAADTCTPAIACQTCHDYHQRPMYFAGRGQCVCSVGGTKDDLIPVAPEMNDAHACTSWCTKTNLCRYASWNADTHECIGLRSMDSQSTERPTAWSCFSKRRKDKVEE